jgi:hypothetical protein
MVGVFLTTTTLTAKTGLKFGGYDDGDDTVNNHFYMTFDISFD